MPRARRGRSPFLLFVSAVFFLILGAFFLSPPDSDQGERVILKTELPSDTGAISSLIETHQQESKEGWIRDPQRDGSREASAGADLTDNGALGGKVVENSESKGTHSHDSSSDPKASGSSTSSESPHAKSQEGDRNAGTTTEVDCDGVLNGTIEVDMPRYCGCVAEKGAAKDPRLFPVNVDVDGTTFSINVYKRGDIVSGSILRDKWWELDTSRMFVKLMNDEYRQRAVANPSLKKSDLTFLDIGANIGWYSLLMAAEGFKVVSIEPMTKNFDALRSSVCQNKLENSVTVHKTGLSEEKRECKIVSDVGNTGDGIIVCDDAWSKSNYETREVVHINRLDDVISGEEPIVFAKIDVEGYEDHVLGGANKTLLHSNISKIMSEFSPRMMGDAQSDPVHYLKTWSEAGYTIRERGFGSGPVISPSTFESKVKRWSDTILNIFIEKEVE
ncbi:hypothetical protein BSKO_06053 [Bryopsis sp. KO-2023]|nr:hypothetical protein BSKO_06053 [Bryopsis sp. KO-2023]